MSTHCVFYRTGKRMNSTLQPSVDGNTWEVDCNFFEPFDVLSPEILLRDEGLGLAAPPNNNHIMDYNYVYIQAPVERYYFINKWERIKGIWHGYTSEDVLASWRNTILETQQYITRSSIKWNDTIPDNFYGYKTIPYNSASAAFRQSTSGYTWQTPMGGTGYTDHRLYAVVNTTELGVNSEKLKIATRNGYLILNLDTENYLNQILSKMRQNLDQENINLANFISRLYYLPIEPLRNANTYQVFPEYPGVYPNYFVCGDDRSEGAAEGKTYINITGDGSNSRKNEIRPVKQNNYVTLIWNADIPDKSSIAWENGSDRTIMTINFQPYGTIQLDPNIYVGETQVSLYQTIYLPTGDSILEVKTGTGRRQIAAANIAQEIPISTIVNNGEAYRRQTIQNAFNIANAVTNNLTSSVQGALQGSSKGPAGAIAGGVVGGVTSVQPVIESIWTANDRPPIQVSGSISGLSGSIIDQVPTLNVLRYRVTDRDDARFGRPLCEKLVLGSQLTGATSANNYTIAHPGLVVCQGAQIKSGTGIEIGQGILAAERAAIESALNGGVYLE